MIFVDTSAFLAIENRRDHEFSFTDCTSFILMERLKIKKAFTFDAHFKSTENLTSALSRPSTATHLVDHLTECGTIFLLTSLII